MIKANEYIVRKDHVITINGETLLTSQQVVEAIRYANTAIKSINNATKKFDINVFDTLGMRNLSGMVGEIFAHSLKSKSGNTFEGNMHQDGYPDLLLVNTPEKRKYFDSLYKIINGKRYPFNKSDFSPFKYGGIEIKATCGSTPSSKVVPKPLIGEQRINLLVGFDWKAHHRTTNNLLSILWDFINGVPTIVACFYRNDLTVNDWGKIVQPREGGGRTTSVSIMTAKGVSKMCKGWLAVINNKTYTQTLSSKKWIGTDVSE